MKSKSIAGGFDSMCCKKEPDTFWGVVLNLCNMQMTSDPESSQFLARMGEQEKTKSNRVPGVRTVLIVLSSAGMVFDVESLRQKVLLSYPDAAVFFLTTQGKSIGTPPPAHIDLLVDFTGPGQRQGLLMARKLRRMSRVAAGRNAGFFRKKIYDRVYDEKAKASELDSEVLVRERQVQKEVLAMAGIAFVPAGDTAPDRGKLTPMESPPYSKL
jgi:hypothetical protein